MVNKNRQEALFNMSGSIFTFILSLVFATLCFRNSHPLSWAMIALGLLCVPGIILNYQEYKKLKS